MLEVNPAAKKIGNGTLRYSGNITVIENISDKSYKVKASALSESLSGTQEFTVFSKNKLLPGDTIKGTIIARGNILYLSVLKAAFQAQQNNLIFESQDYQINTKNQIIQKTDIMQRFLASFFDTTGKKPDNILLLILESLISKKKITDIFCAVLAGEAYLKGFKNEAAISGFLSVVSPDQEKNQGGHKHGKKNKKEEIKGILSKAVSDSDQEESSLFVFNHLPLPDKNWQLIPFRIDDIKGDIRLKTEPEGISQSELKALVIHVEKGHFKWFFELSDLKNSEKTVKIYANKEAALVCQGEKFDLFKKKLQNLGVKFDDNIYDIHTFNGFSKINASYDVDLRI